MSVKILVHDLPNHLRKVVDTCIREIGQIAYGETKLWKPQWVRDANPPREVLDKISKYQRLLADDSLWKTSSERPYRLSSIAQYQGETDGKKTEVLGVGIKPGLLNEGHFYIYKSMFCHVAGPYSLDEEEALVKGCYDKKRSKLDSLVSQGNESGERKRTVIPQTVRHEVWRRDQGQCVECGSKENLEYDHLIPFSKGGSNTARNLRLLCEKCNRTKSDSI